MDNKSAAESKKRRSGSGKAPICEHLSFASKEAFKRLRTNLVMSFPQEDTSCHLVGVTSAQPSDGKSTISLNLAFSLAELGKKTLLIDADLRRASQHEKMGFTKVPGLNELVSGDSGNIQASMRKYQSSNSATSFDFIPAGEVPKNPSELLNSERMARLMETLSTAYDFIVVDLPPIGAVIDAVSVAQELDGMLVVIRENACPRGLLADCMQQLSYANVNILGFVINGAMEGSGKRYQYGGYGGYSSYGSYGYY